MRNSSSDKALHDEEESDKNNKFNESLLTRRCHLRRQPRSGAVLRRMPVPFRMASNDEQGQTNAAQKEKDACHAIDECNGSRRITDYRVIRKIVGVRVAFARTIGGTRPCHPSEISA